MSSAWLLPEHIADVLPAQARHIETLRRRLTDAAIVSGFELVIPPLVEHVESLLAGVDDASRAATFTMTDQLSGRALGLRADSTLQVARIDAHLLNRAGVTRLCYCGPVLQPLPQGLHASREPLQFGAEIYGHAGLEADHEIQDLALDCLSVARVDRLVLDLGDTRIVRAVLAGAVAGTDRLAAVYAALAAKDAAAVVAASAGFSAETRQALRTLLRLYGGVEVLAVARRELPDRAAIRSALDDLEALAGRIGRAHPDVAVGFDLADVGSRGYYSGPRFAVYTPASPDAVVRGGRYDEVGSAFGRNRAAVGFGLDLKALASIAPAERARTAIRAPALDDADLRAEIRALRAAGETVVRTFVGPNEHDPDAPVCDRELVIDAGRWRLRAIAAPAAAVAT